MRRILFACLLFPLLVRADWDQLFPEEDGDPSLFHHVNVITGNLNLSFEDTIVQGAISIPLTRTYTSSGALERSPKNIDLEMKKLCDDWLIQGGWNFFPHINLLIERGLERKTFRAFSPEKTGAMLEYVFSDTEGNDLVYLKPKTSPGQSPGVISARTNTQNNLLRINKETGEAVLFTPDGGRRIYHGADLKEYNSRKRFQRARLTLEVLPSGQNLHYSYDNSSRLVHVAMTNSSGSKTYSWIHFDLLRTKTPFQFQLRTSDGKTLNYRAAECKERDYLCSVISQCRPAEEIGYIHARKGLGARLQSLTIAGAQQLFVKYCKPLDGPTEKLWAQKPKTVPYSADKVHTIHTPAGLIAEFAFVPGCTDVRDADRLLIRYRHDLKKLSRIEYYDARDQIKCLQQFLWNGDRLQSKSMHDSKSVPWFSKTLKYDAPGNVIEEVFWGNLTGQTQSPFTLNSDGTLSGAESYRKQYSYLPGFNVPLLEKEEEGPTIRYAYKSGTDLLSSKYICDQDKIVIREFFLYNDDNLRIAEITDDGSSSDPNDTTSVSWRRIHRYERDPNTGQVATFVEAYWDPTTAQEVIFKRIEYTYNAQGLPNSEAIYDAEGNYRYTLFTEYNPQGKVTRKTNPLGQENAYLYDAWGQLIESKEPGSSKKIYTYDPLGNPKNCLQNGKYTHTSYDSKGRLLSQKDTFDNTTSQIYDSFGQCLQTTFPETKDEEGQQYSPYAQFSYDAQGNLASSTTPQGETTKTWYQAWRKPYRILQPDGSEIWHTYNKCGTLAKTIYPDQTEVHYTYDLFQRITSKTIHAGSVLSSEHWTYSAFHLLSYTDPTGLKTTYAYDSAGRKIAENCQGRVKKYVYDSLGFLEKTTEGDTTYVQIHDVAGRIIQQWEEDSTGCTENFMKFQYNDDNRKEKIVRLTSQGEAVDLLSYDKQGRLTSHIDPLGAETKIAYDEQFYNDLGQRVLQKITLDPLGNASIETLDSAGRLVSSEKKNPEGQTVALEQYFYDRSGNFARRDSSVYLDDKHIKTITSSWEYDSVGRVIKEIEAGQKITLNSYDIRGRLQERTLPSGIVFSYAYDGLSRMTEQKSSDRTIHYRYTYLQGRCPTEVTDLVSNITIKRQYNPFGQLVSEHTPYGQNLYWDYDQHGRCTNLTLPDGSSIHYDYLGRHLSSVKRGSYQHNYTHFDPNGHVKQEQLISNLGVVETKHDLLERPSVQISPWISHTISYGPSGLVMNTSNTLLGDRSYAYDPLNQLLKEGDQEYQFDSIGNPAQCETNDLNQILSTSQTRIAYDPDGNPCSKTTPEGPILYTYDALGRLTSATYPEWRKICYAYDPFSRLLSKETYIHIQDYGWSLYDHVFYLYDHEKEIGTCYPGGSLLELKVLGLGTKGEIGATVAIEIRGAVFAPLHDLSGNIIALISSSGKIAETYRLTAFGQETTTPAAPLNPWRFCSKRSDEGLVFFGKRFYDPSLGRWLTPDPSGFADGPNLYAYVLNSPLNRLDLFGLSSELANNLAVNIEAFVTDIPITPNIQKLVLCKGYMNGVAVDWIVSCSHWHKLQFTPEEVGSNKVDLGAHFSELVPKDGLIIGLVTAQNGIKTTFDEFKSNCKLITDKLTEGTLFMGIYNPTEGGTGFKDLCRALKEKVMEKDTNIVCQTAQFMEAVASSIHKIHPQLLWLHIAHSEAGAIAYRSIERMTPEGRELLKKHLYVYAVAPATCIPKAFAFDAVNVYSEKDRFTKWFAQEREGYKVEWLNCTSTPEQMPGGFDHYFSGNTYQEAIKDKIKNLRGIYKFYDGKKR